ncbi:MAG: hypothetical protein ACJ75H_14400 [Thermoanaerobaculia bacterium]
MRSVPRPRISGETALFWLLLGLHLLPVWLFPFFPSQDGPGHQALAFILRQYGEPGAGLLRQYYLPNHQALPNWFVFFLMSKALGFVPVPMAEKILLTAYVALLPLSARYALRAVSPRAGFLAVLAFPFVYNFTAHMGFFNFCFSLPAFFFAAGFWLKRPERMGPLRVAGLALLILWVYFCHPVTLAVTVTTLGTLAGWRMLTGPDRWAGARRWLTGPVVASLPALILMGSFIVARTGSKVSMLPLWVKIKHLAGLYSLVSLTRWTIPLALALAVLFYAVALLCLKDRGRRGVRPGDGFLIAAGVLALADLAAPSDLSGGGFINHRLALFPFLALLLWFGTFEHSPARRRGIQIAGAAIAVAFLSLFAAKYAEIDDGLSEIAAAGRYVEPDHTFLFLSYAHQGEGADGGPIAFRTWPFVHAGAYIATEKRLVDLSLYEAGENYFPIYFNPRLDPFRHLAAVPLGIEAQPPRVDLAGYAAKTGGRVDYVMLWGSAAARDAATQGQLRAAYQEIYAAPDGRVRLYRSRGTP